MRILNKHLRSALRPIGFLARLKFYRDKRQEPNVRASPTGRQHHYVAWTQGFPFPFALLRVRVHPGLFSAAPPGPRSTAQCVAVLCARRGDQIPWSSRPWLSLARAGAIRFRGRRGLGCSLRQEWRSDALTVEALAFLCVGRGDQIPWPSRPWLSFWVSWPGSATMDMEMSAARAEWVSAPTLMKSTPASA